MSKRVCIISTSLRMGGNSDLLAEEFARGAREAGHEVVTISLADKQIGFCKGCLACQKINHCVISDDANKIVEEMIKSDVIAFATPVYFYEMSGQMKTLLDRSNPVFPVDYSFRDIYLLTAAAEEEKTAMDGTINGLQGWINCFEKARLAGVIYGVGVTDIADVKKAPQLLIEAFEMGKAIV